MRNCARVRKNDTLILSTTSGAVCASTDYDPLTNVAHRRPGALDGRSAIWLHKPGPEAVALSVWKSSATDATRNLSFSCPALQKSS
jgi:hypothetical protein